MQSPEEFMRQYFRARTADIQRELSSRGPFRQKFFTDDCVWDSHKTMTKRSESEEILSVSGSGTTVEVITRNFLPVGKLCYHLRPTGETWLIQRVEPECLACHGTGSTSNGIGTCIVCGGEGWGRNENPPARSNLGKSDANGFPPPRRF